MAMLAEERQEVVSMGGGGYIMWLGLAVSYFLLWRASELWAHANGQVHPEFLSDTEMHLFISRRSAGGV